MTDDELAKREHLVLSVYRALAEAEDARAAGEDVSQRLATLSITVSDLPEKGGTDFRPLPDADIRLAELEEDKQRLEKCIEIRTG